jgi:hypothetical protein
VPVRKRCPALPAFLACVTLQLSLQAYETDMWFGTIRPPLAPPIGQVTDRIFIGDNFEGLVYADQDLLGLGTTATLFYTVRHDMVSGLAHLDTIGTPIAPHVGPFVMDRVSLGSLDYNALAFAAPDLSLGSTSLYYLRRDPTEPQFGTITPPGMSYQDRFGIGQGFDSLTFSATDVSFGANLLYYLRQDVDGTHFGTMDPHLPGTITDRWLMPSGDFDALVFTDTDVGYGANQFYYIRHDALGQHAFGTINPLTGAVVDRFNIGTTGDTFTELSFTTTDLGYGANLFYYLRGASDIPEAGAFWSVGVLGVLLTAWQWRRRRAQAGTVTI